MVAAIPKDQLRSMFYLFAGKPDSRIKVFETPVYLKPSDITELNDCVVRKLKIHSIDASVTSLTIGYVGADISEFGTWAEFESHHWQEPEKIEELVIKWDFLVNIEQYTVPQRHTLLFRVSTDMKPGKLLQLLSSGNSDEFDQVDMFTAPAFCRVDFINAQLSKELINVVSDWYLGRPSPELIPSAYFWFKRRRQTVAELLDHWFVLSWALLFSSFLLYAASHWYQNNVPIHIAVVACFFGCFSLRPISRLARSVAGKVFDALKKLEGSRVVFEFTSGDKKRIGELKLENAKQGRSFIGAAAWNIFLNLVASGLYAYLFSSASTG